MINILKEILQIKQPKPSVYFYTFHKCASSLFANFILKNCEGLKHVDYAKEIYLGSRTDMTLKYKSHGEIYGPIRISANPNSLVYNNLVKPTTCIDFVEGKKQVFFIRDPRDILISAYYSYGFTHGISPVDSIGNQQTSIRDSIVKMSLEEYILSEAENQDRHFKILHKLSKVNTDSVVLKYEDLIDNFDHFKSQLEVHLTLKENTKSEIFKKSRPIQKENTKSHRRSGGVRTFESKLDKKTILLLNDKLEETLRLFNYEI